MDRERVIPDQTVLVAGGHIKKGEILAPRLILARMIDGPDRAWPPPLSIWVATSVEARQAVLAAKEDGYDAMKVYSFLDPVSYDAIVSTAGDVGLSVIGHIPVALFDDLDAELSRPETRYFQHPMQQGVWSFIINSLYQPIPEAQCQAIRDGFEQFQPPFTRALHDRGVKLLVGTDSPLPTMVPGFILHRELEELVAVGPSPYEALRSSTTHPFDYLGELDEAGTIEVGKRANLVLLEENPLLDIAHSRTVAGVVVQGRWLSGDQIRDGMARVLAQPAAHAESGAQ